MTTTVRETRRADELKAGDWLASKQITGDGDRPVEVLSVHPTTDICGLGVLLVYRTFADRAASIASDAHTIYELTTDAEMREVRTQGERARKIADIRKLADWLENNPDVPMPYGVGGQADIGTGTVADVAAVKQFADRFGGEYREGNDRTTARLRFASVDYTLIAWHKDGRPAESKPLVDPDASMGAHYDAEADAQAYLGEMHAKADEVRAARADAAQRGLLYTRDDDDPTPVSPARVPAHVGAVTENGLVDETGPTPAGPGCPGCGTPPGGLHATACGVRPWAQR